VASASMVSPFGSGHARDRVAAGGPDATVEDVLLEEGDNLPRLRGRRYRAGPVNRPCGDGPGRVREQQPHQHLDLPGVDQLTRRDVRFRCRVHRWRLVGGAVVRGDGREPPPGGRWRPGYAALKTIAVAQSAGSGVNRQIYLAANRNAK